MWVFDKTFLSFLYICVSSPGPSSLSFFADDEAGFFFDIPLFNTKVISIKNEQNLKHLLGNFCTFPALVAALPSDSFSLS